MLKPGEKHFVRRVLFGKVALIVLTLVFIIFARGTWNVYQKSAYAKENRVQAEQELEELRVREQALQEELDRLETQRGLEEEIRHTFDVGFEGERLIVLVDAPDPEPIESEAPQSIWQRITSFFGFK